MTSNPEPASQLPTLSRRQATGAESARSLLFTILGELVLPTGGRAWTSAFIEILGRLGVEEKAARQALMRTGADQWLRSERVGRRTLWHLTPAAETLLRDGAARIFQFRPVDEGWDGTWTLVLARTPETIRPIRHALRTRLSWAGFGNPAPGVWLSPGSGRRDRARQILTEAGVADGQIFLATHDSGTSLGAMIEQAWDLDALAAGYDAFIAAFTSEPSSDAIVRIIELVHDWRRFPWTDPGLPAQFLPAEWSGIQAAELFARLHHKWAADALERWQELSGVHTW